MQQSCDSHRIAAQNIKTFKKRLNVEISYFNQAKPSLYSLFLKIKLDLFDP